MSVVCDVVWAGDALSGMLSSSGSDRAADGEGSVRVMHQCAQDATVALASDWQASPSKAT